MVYSIEPMIEAKTRSSFLPILLIAGGIVGLVILLALAPLWNCEQCEGAGVMTMHSTDSVTFEIKERNIGVDTCTYCNGQRRFSLFGLWRMDARQRRYRSMITGD